MKKYKRWFLLGIVVIMSFISCSEVTPSEESKVIPKKSDNPLIQEVANEVNFLQKAGQFDLLFNEAVTRSLSATEAQEIEEAKDFIEDPITFLEKLEEEDGGEEQLILIHSMFAGSSTQSVSQHMYAVNSEMAVAYEESLAAIEGSTEEKTRSLNSQGPLYVNLRSNNEQTRGYLSYDFHWSTVGLYAGTAAATIGGIIMVQFGGFITRIAGRVIAYAGSAAMSVQLYRWGKIFSDNAGKSQYDDRLMSLLNKHPEGKSTMIIGATIATTVAALFSPKMVAAVKADYLYLKGKAKSLKSYLPLIPDGSMKDNITKVIGVLGG